ncbi:MAG: alanine dehydrogenase [Bacteroidales bacterium]|nr:alanine dehydrogenase [Bacteroidales bacterium]
MAIHNPEFFSMKSGKMLPKEEMLEVKKQNTQLHIGILKETTFQENRVAMVPDAVGLLISNGHSVTVETKAGEAAHFPDNKYSEAGATVSYSKEEVLKADIILKVTPPSVDEIKLMKGKQTIFSAISVGDLSSEYFKEMISKKITAIALERIQDKAGSFSFLRSMSEIAGNTSILIAAEYLSNIHGGKGLMVGGIAGITPTEVVILGAGTVGESAARAAMGLGAVVKVFDNNIYKLRRLQNNLGAKVFTSILQSKVLTKALKAADVVIGALHDQHGRTPCVVTEDMVKEMKFGSVIVDVSIDKGGCFETSRTTNHSEPVFEKYDVIHYCVPNIPSRVSRTASYALSNFLTPIILNVAEEGGINNVIKTDLGIRHGVYVYNGILTDKNIGETYNLPYKDINLLLAAF